MKRIFIQFVTILLISFLFVQNSYAVIAYPHPIEYKLPDGSKITIVLKGDEKVRWAETMDGYSVLLNKEGFYEYAILNEKGDMVRSGIRAYNFNERTNKQKSTLSGIPKKLQFNSSQVSMMKQIWQIKEKNASKAFPTTGSRKLVCLLIGYTDKAFTKTQLEFQNLFNQIGYSTGGATGSVKDYYLENSYNQFNLTVDVAGPYTASQNMAYYGANDGSGYDVRPDVLVTEAVNLADADVDFSDYDNDGDGSVDGVYAIYAGYGEEAGGGANAIWAHAWAITPVTKDGVSISRYSCSAELRDNSGSNITNIGVICHEFGHVLSAPDFYDTDYDDDGTWMDGTGEWDMMAGGSWNNDGATPAHHNMFTKYYYYGWVTPTVLSSGASISLNNSAENAEAYIINTTTSNEYFLIENRQQVGFDANVPGSGLIIYHVDQDGVDAHDFGNDINATHPMYMYPVAQNSSYSVPSSYTQYGTIDAATCAWNGTVKTSFTDASTPSMKSWAGANTSKPITNIAESSGVITFDFMGGAAATITVSDASLDFEKVYSGFYSRPQSYTVTGSGLSANITVTAPTGIEVTTTCGSGYGSSVTLTQSGGTVNATVYARYTGGTVSANITHASTGATTQNVSISETASSTNLPGGYYSSATGTGTTLRDNLEAIIDGHTIVGYDNLWTAFEDTDVLPNGYVWDMYSDKGGCVDNDYYYTHITDKDNGTLGSAEGDWYNREHSFPASWFGSVSPTYSDLFHLYPTDKYVNNQRSNYEFGEVTSGTTYSNGSMLGNNTYTGSPGATAFEPIDEYKGDFARSYFYLATRYASSIAGWTTSPMIDGDESDSDGSVFEEWALNMLLEWHTNDPVSQKEMTRNDEIYLKQNNRNPFIDNPDYVNDIWGTPVVDPEPTNQATGFSATANGSSQIDLSWTDAATGSQAPDGYLILANETGTFTAPSDGTDPSIDTDLSDGSGVMKVSHGTGSYSFTGLSAETTYYFKMWSYTNSGANVDFNLNATVPTGNATTDAEGGGGGCPTELFISEYSEGSLNNKYIEIYNGTGSSVDLGDYALWKISNGGSWTEATLALSGTLADGDVYVVCNSSASATIKAEADIQEANITSFNGDDAIGLAKLGTLVDAVGTSGADPGSGWDVAGTTNGTADHTIIRKSAVQSGNTDWTASAGTNTSDSEWTVYAVDTWTDIGTHTMDACGGSTPTLTVSPSTLTGFTYEEGAGGPSAVQSFTISGTDLNGTDVTLTAPTNYEISTTDFSASSPITLASFDGTETTIYVRLKAGLSVGTYNGETIAIAGGGDADGESVTCSGNVSNLPDWCNLQWPASDNIYTGETYDVYARIYESGVTDAAGQGAGVSCWIGYNTTDTDPSTWTNWVAASYNADTDGTSNDEYVADIGSALPAGTYYYASRFTVDGTNYSYGGYSVGGGGVWDGSSYVSGTLTVTVNYPDWCNLQWPETGSIDLGDAYNVYARVFETGVTEAAGQGAGITAWIGYSTTDTDPSTWSNWVAATYNIDDGNNDEYVADIGAEIPSGGTYYYASRFSVNGTDYKYGGYNAGEWNGTTNVSGVLTVASSGPCGSEDFTNVTDNGSYNTKSWTGLNSVDWIATDARSDVDLDGDEAIMLRNGSLTNDASVAGGCGTLEFDYAQIYSGGSTLKVYVNSVQYGGDITVSSTSSTHFSTLVDVTGDIDVEIQNSGNRTLISNLQWSCNSGPSNDTDSEVDGPVLGSQPDPVLLSSLADTDGEAVRVFDFDVWDYGTADGLATKITQVTIKAGGNNDVDWSTAIQGVKLSTDAGSTFVTIGSPTINASSIVIPITSGNLDIADGDAETVSLFIWFESSGLTDNGTLEFEITAADHGFTSDAAGSSFAASFSGNTISNEMLIDVVATELTFVNVPTSVNIDFDFGLTVNATDANGNIDADETSTVTLARNVGTGALTSTLGLAQSLVAGSYTWSDLQFDAAESFTITAAAAGLTGDETGSISCSYVLTIGDGTETGSGYKGPLYNFYENAVSQMVYLNAELGNPKTITHYALEIAQVSAADKRQYVDFTIKMLNTDLAVFTGTEYIDMSDAQTVYFSALEELPGSTGWWTIDITDFEWYAPNMVVEISWGDNDESTMSNPFLVNMTNMGANLSNYGYQDGLTPAPFDGLSVYRPNVQLTYVPGNDADSEIETPASQIAGGTLSSVANDDLAGAVEVFRFNVVDHGTDDGVATKIKNVRLYPGATNTIDWSDHIQGVTLSGNNLGAITINSVSITDEYIDCAISLNNFNVADGATEIVTVSTYLNTSGIVDAGVLSMQVPASNHGFVTDFSGSIIKWTLDGAVSSNDFTIEVIGTELQFVQQPSSTMQNVNMSPKPTVKACDANGNVDVNYSTHITITSSGTLSGSPVTGVLADGEATFTLKHTATGTGLTLTASSSGLPDEGSAPFNITELTYCTDLMISEYMEGSGDDKAIELFNGTGGSVLLSGYQLRQDNGHDGDWDYTLTLPAEYLPHGELYLIINSSASTAMRTAIGAENIDYQTGDNTLKFGGDDIIALFKDNSGKAFELLDVVGDGTNYEQVNLIRNADVFAPNATFTLSEWTLVNPFSYGDLGSTDNPLPVTWRDVTATGLQRGVLVKWSTLSEINNDYFEVEHSLDNVSYTTVGRVEGMGTTANEQAYSYTHQGALPGVNYYRIKQVDFDGAFDYSRVVSADFGNGLGNELAIEFVFADVTKHNAVVRYVSERTFQVEIFDITGNLVYKAQQTADGYFTTIDFSDAGLKQGLYIFTVRGIGATAQQKFIVR